MNVLLISSKYMPEYSGSGFRAHNLYKRLRVAHPEIKLNVISGSVIDNTILTYKYDGITVNKLACKPYPKISSNSLLRRYQNARNFNAEFEKALQFMRNSIKPDLIHIFGQDYVTAAALEFARRHNIPTLIELCNEMDNPHHYIPFPYNHLISGKPSNNYKFICISERLKNVCLKNGIPEKNIWCRPNPIDEKRFRPVNLETKMLLRRKYTKFNEHDKVIAYVAKYIPRKNHRFLLDVLERLPDEFKLFIGGPIAEDGPLKNEGQNILREIRSFIDDHNLNEKVQFEYGFCENIEHYYQMADIYAFPTKEEGLGTPMLEAVACGLPVVANCIPGITDTWIRDAENGCISSLNPADFARKIKEALKIPHKQMLEQAEKISSKAGTKVIDEKYWELLQRRQFLSLREKPPLQDPQ